MGRVAELDAVPKAVARAGPIDPINLEEKIAKNQFLISFLPEWKLSSDHGVDDGKDDESLGGDAKADGNQVPVQHHMLPLKAIYQKHIGRMLVKLQEIGYDIRIKGSR